VTCPDRQGQAVGRSNECTGWAADRNSAAAGRRGYGPSASFAKWQFQLRGEFGVLVRPVGVASREADEFAQTRSLMSSNTNRNDIKGSRRFLELSQRGFEEAVGSVPNLLVHRLDASHDVSQWDTADQPTLQGHHVTEAALVDGVDGRSPVPAR